jgi:hypothetical protein
VVLHFKTGTGNLQVSVDIPEYWFISELFSVYPSSTIARASLCEMTICVVEDIKTSMSGYSEMISEWWIEKGGGGKGHGIIYIN